MSAAEPFTVRRARPDELDKVLDVVNTVFTRRGWVFDFARSHPYLCHEARVPNHFVADGGDAFWGVVGAYPFDVKLGGVAFKTAGIGQVTCREEFRGRGVMTALLNAAIQGFYDDGLDLAWLGGDRLRYERFGWACGGRTLYATTYQRYLPGPAGAVGVRPLDRERDLARILGHIHSLPDAILIPEAELKMLMDAGDLGGWVLHESFILMNRQRACVYFADGRPEKIALLISRQQQINKAADEKRKPITIALADAPSPLMEVCRDCYSDISARPAAMFRVVCLVPFLEKAGRIVEGRVPQGADRLGLVNTDTGEAATISADDGKIQVTPGAGDDAVRLDTREISELFFGWMPTEYYLPRLAPNSPLRSLFPLNVHLSQFMPI